MSETITPCLAQISLALSNRINAIFFLFSCMDATKSAAAKKNKNYTLKYHSNEKQNKEKLLLLQLS
jgi:hypothetical protein